MFRFFVDKKVNDYFELSPETVKHIKVSRVQNENIICIYENTFYVAKIEGNKALIINKLEDNHEMDYQITIAASIIDIKRFEWMIQKATELGAYKIIPMVSKRVVKKLDNLDKKIVRWNKIAQNAAEQSFRNIIPQVTNIETFEKVITSEFAGKKYIAHEKETTSHLESINDNAIFLIGPEGGFADEEVNLAISNNYQSISLGKRILRAETAPLYILAKINS